MWWVQDYTYDWVESKITLLDRNALYFLHGLQGFLPFLSLPFPYMRTGTCLLKAKVNHNDWLLRQSMLTTALSLPSKSDTPQAVV